MATFCACFLLFQREPAKEKILKKQRIFCLRTKFLRFSGYLFRNSETKASQTNTPPILYMVGGVFVLVCGLQK